MSATELPDTGPGDPTRDHNLDRFVNVLEVRVDEVVQILNDLNALSDQVGPMCLGFSLDLHARATVALRDARDAVSLAKTRLTAAELANGEWFAARIAQEGDTHYKTETHSFKAGGRGFYSLPSQLKRADEFHAALKWLQEQPTEPKIVYDIDQFGVYAVENLDDVCTAIREAGLPLHSAIGEHLVATVKVTKRK